MHYQGHFRKKNLLNGNTTCIALSTKQKKDFTLIYPVMQIFLSAVFFSKTKGQAIVITVVSALWSSPCKKKNKIGYN